MSKLFLIILLVAVVLVGWACKPGDSDKFITVEVDGFQHTLENSGDDCVLVDVRTQSEYDEGHLKGAILIDVKDSVGFMNKAKEVLPIGKNIMVYCRSGRRSAKAAGMLAAEGYLVFNLKGGYKAWTEAGKETEK